MHNHDAELSSDISFHDNFKMGEAKLELAAVSTTESRRTGSEVFSNQFLIK